MFNSLCWSQGETAQEFKNRLKVIGDRLELPESVVKHRFIHGLPDNVKPQLLPFYDQSLKNLMDMAQNLLNLNVPSKLLTGVSNVNCVETVEVKSGDGDRKDVVTDLKSEVGKLRRELSEVKQNVLAGSYLSYDHFSDGFYPEDQDDGYGYYGEEESADFDSYYSGQNRFRSSFRRPGYRGFRGRGSSKVEGVTLVVGIEVVSGMNKIDTLPSPIQGIILLIVQKLLHEVVGIIMRKGFASFVSVQAMFGPLVGI